jgi:hypothetical protein
MNDLDTLWLPKTCFHVNDNGEFTKRIYEDAPMENTMFWRRRHKLVAGLIGIPTLVFVMVLLFETNMLQDLWSGLLYSWFFFWGLFF